MIALTTARGRRVVADRFLFNGDPKLLRLALEARAAGRPFSLYLDAE